MFDSKAYHREYMKKYRENVIKNSPEKQERIRELDKARYYRRKESPEELAAYRKWHREWMKNKRKDNPEKRKSETDARREYYKTDNGKKAILKARKKYEETHPERRQAWWKTQYAKKVGKIKKLPCRDCGTTKRVHAHHPDVLKPLEVVFLCPLHHSQEELKIKQII